VFAGIQVDAEEGPKDRERAAPSHHEVPERGQFDGQRPWPMVQRVSITRELEASIQGQLKFLEREAVFDRPEEAGGKTKANEPRRKPGQGIEYYCRHS